MAHTLRVKDMVAPPGQRVEGRLVVGEMADGSPVSLPVLLINGAHEGPTLYLQAVSDGDELNGIGVIHRVLPQISPQQLHGQLIIVPVVNFHAFHARRASSPIDQKKMNRCFPGDPEGTSSERIAYTLFDNAVRQSDYCIDLHQGGVNPMVDEVRVRVGKEHRLHGACFELARVFGIGRILDQQGPQGQLARAAPDIGIPTIDPELGGCYGWNDASIDKGVQGVMNVLFHYGLLEGTPVVPPLQTVISNFRRLISRHGGFVHYRVLLGEELQPGQPIAEITDVFGRTREILEAPQQSIFWAHQRYPMVASGEWVCTLGLQPRICS